MTIQNLTVLPWEEVSHNAAIKKRVLLRRGDLEHLTQFAEARFSPGHSAPAHFHPDMAEVFLVTEGTATAIVDGQSHSLPAGSCLVVEPGEEHELRNDAAEDLVLIYFGLQAGPKI